VFSLIRNIKTAQVLAALLGTAVSLSGLETFSRSPDSALYAQGEVNNQELVNDAQLQQLKRNGPQLFTAMGQTNLKQADIALLSEMTQIQVLQMSRKDKQTELADIRERLKRDLNLRATPAVRSVMIPEVIKNCEALLQHPLPVRLNACLLITEMNEEPGQVARQVPAKPWVGMTDPLLKVLNDPEQHVAVKVIAANGLMRLCQDGSPKVDVRSRIADTMISELNKPNLHEWYQRTLVQAVSYTDVLFDKARRPYIVQKLAEILVDSKQPWSVRAEAAAGLGRTNMNGEINVSLVSHEIVRFAHEMGQQFNANPKAPHWRYCAFRVYTAYKPESSGKQALLTRTQSPPLSGYRAEVASAYDVVLPVVNGILSNNVANPKAMAPTILEKADTWLDQNPPPNLTIGPNVKPLRNAG